MSKLDEVGKYDLSYCDDKQEKQIDCLYTDLSKSLKALERE